MSNGSALDVGSRCEEVSNEIELFLAMPSRRDGSMTPVGFACRQLIADWQHVLLTQSVCLVVPVMLPSKYDDPLAQRRHHWLRGLRVAANRSPANGGS